jgi:TRAP transporter TAXI family solute receptor
MYDSPLQFVTLRRSGITTVAQLNNRNVGVGPRAGPQAIYVQQIFSAIGISAKFVYGSWESQASDLLEGRCDALGAIVGIPFPVLKKVEAKEPVAFASLTPEQIETSRKAMPELNISQIDAGVYPFLEKTYTTVGLFTFVIGRDDLPDELVYQLVKAVFENQPRLLKAHSAARETIPPNVERNTFLPFHPGAIRYYREIGIKIPESLIPKN